MRSLVLALTLLSVAIRPANAAAVEDNVVLTMNSTKYCVGVSWNLTVRNAKPNAPIRLMGATKGAPWELPQWANTDATGSFSTSGAFAAESVGKHTLQVEVAGA